MWIFKLQQIEQKKKSELKGEEKHTSDAQSLARPNLHALKDKMVHEEG